MSAGRDDFGIAFRSALLQKGAAQKFSLVSLVIVALIIFFLDVYKVGFMKPARSIINPIASNTNTGSQKIIAEAGTLSPACLTVIQRSEENSRAPSINAW